MTQSFCGTCLMRPGLEEVLSSEGMLSENQNLGVQ